MSPSLRRGLALAALAVLPAPLLAQQPLSRDLAPERPLRKPTRRELDHLEAVKLYGLAAHHEYENRLPEALRTYEKALRLDPDSAAIRKAMIPLYLALDRRDDGLACCRKVLDLEPGDFETRYLYARQLLAAEREADARAALEKALACKGLADKPDVHLSIAYDLGVLREKAGKLAAAEQAFRTVVSLLEKSNGALEEGPLSKQELAAQVADTWERIGRLCLKVGQPDKAVAAFKSAQARDPSRAARLSLNLAEVLHARKRDAEALRYIDHYLGEQPSGTEGYELKIKLLRALGRGRDVVPALEKHFRIDHHNEELERLLGREYRLAGRLTDADRLYRKQLGRSANVEAYRGLFEVWKQEGGEGVERLLNRLHDAVAAAKPDDDKQMADEDQAAHARAMLAALREDAPLVKALLLAAHQRILKGPPLAFRVRVLLGALAERTRQLDVAERLYRSCLDGEGRVRPFGVRRESEQEVYYGLLNVLARAHKHRAIIELCNQGLKVGATSHRGVFFHDLATAEMGLGHTKEALAAIDKAVEVTTDRFRLACRCDKARFLAQAERFDEAIAEGKKLLKEHKADADARLVRFTLSEIYSECRKLDEAEAQLKAVLAADSNDARANNDLGYFWADRNKNLDEAERMVRKALELDRQQRKSDDALGLDGDRDNAAYIDSLGWVLFRRGKLKEARELLEKASGLPGGSDDPVVWDHLGDVYAKQKADAKAVAAWRKALRLYDTDRRRTKADGRYQDIEQKIKLLETSAQPN